MGPADWTRIARRALRNVPSVWRDDCVSAAVEYMLELHREGRLTVDVPLLHTIAYRRGIDELRKLTKTTTVPMLEFESTPMSVGDELDDVDDTLELMAQYASNPTASADSVRVLVLLAGGRTQAETAEIMKVTPARISQHASNLRRWILRKS